MDLSTQPPIILVVDDAREFLIFLDVLLRHVAPRYDIVTALDAHSALHHLTQRTVPVLITDYMLPGMNGLQLSAAAKAASPTTHVILISGDNSAALKQRAREHQVDTFLLKEDIIDRLGDVVQSVLHPAAAPVEKAETKAKAMGDPAA
jgi:two-component system, response regulator, stage 0 sporulation protein F